MTPNAYRNEIHTISWLSLKNLSNYDGNQKKITPVILCFVSVVIGRHFALIRDYDWLRNCRNCSNPCSSCAFDLFISLHLVRRIFRIRSPNPIYSISLKCIGIIDTPLSFNWTSADLDTYAPMHIIFKGIYSRVRVLHLVLEMHTIFFSLHFYEVHLSYLWIIMCAANFGQKWWGNWCYLVTFMNVFKSKPIEYFYFSQYIYTRIERSHQTISLCTHECAFVFYFITLNFMLLFFLYIFFFIDFITIVHFRLLILFFLRVFFP